MSNSENSRQDNTFSLVARCAKTGCLAVVVCTARPAVGNRVPFAAAKVAALATQADTNPELGRKAIARMRGGMCAARTLELTMAEDENRDQRQLSIIAHNGECAVFTGTAVLAQNPWAGSCVGVNCVAAGNLLTGGDVLAAMVAAFEKTRGSLAARMLRALETGQTAGGDKRGKVSAALLVAGDCEDPLVDLRIDLSTDPVRDLRLLYHANLRAFSR